MRITQVWVNVATNSANNLLAYANVIFDDVFVVRGIRVVEKKDGVRLMLMPSRQTKAGTFKDTCHALTKDFRSTIEVAVMSKVESLLNNKEAQCNLNSAK